MNTTEAGILYNALKLHFTSEEYDFIKYNGRTKIKFIPENQFYVFKKLESKYGDNLKDFYIANFLENPKIWVNELLTHEADETYNNWLRKKESLGYIFKNDISELVDNQENINDIFKVKKGFPILMKLVLQKKINIETLLILKNLVKFFNIWEKKINDELVWKSFRMKCLKYEPFLQYDPDKMKYILSEEIKKIT